MYAPAMNDSTYNKPLENPPPIAEGDDSVNRPEGLGTTTAVDLTVTEDLDEDDLPDKVPDDA